MSKKPPSRTTPDAPLKIKRRFHRNKALTILIAVLVTAPWVFIGPTAIVRSGDDSAASKTLFQAQSSAQRAETTPSSISPTPPPNPAKRVITNDDKYKVIYNALFVTCIFLGAVLPLAIFIVLAIRKPVPAPRRLICGIILIVIAVGLLIIIFQFDEIARAFLSEKDVHYSLFARRKDLFVLIGPLLSTVLGGGLLVWSLQANE
jgi:hypothetical protein